MNLNFKVKYKQFPLALNQQYITTNNDTITLETFKCYISNIEIHYTDQSIYKQKDSYHLIDFENPSSLIFPITTNSDKTISKVIFTIGIDSLTNTSGALSGELDPSKGMYWAWQSGYINMKIEGKSSSCKTRKNAFQFHLGGYLKPYNAMRKIELVYNKKVEQLDVIIDLEKFFSTIKLSEINSVMIPGKQAMQMANYATNMFYIE
ncbi:MbnP family protein [Flavobacterium sp. N1994]|uniref:MbnP family protein n=1 Tax=Flavobacterium sp. N1994 TaxID=2986827 RepID=UPI0022223BDE|nr:MbnP family protein [Flavobacterium sp. N1994]